MSRNTKIILAIGGVVLLLCICVGSIALYFGVQAGQALQQAVVTNPDEVATIANEIAEYDLPSGYDEQFGMSLFGFDLVVIAPSPMGRNELIMLMQFPASAGLSQAEMEAQMRQNTQQQLGNRDIQFETVGQTTANIRDTEVTLTLSEGTSEDGTEVRQLMGVFPGKGGPTLLMIQGQVTDWDQARVDTFIESIH